MGNASMQIYVALHIGCKLEVDGIMNVTDKQLATEGEKCCVCCINRINRPENGFWIQLTVLGRHFYYQLIGSGRDSSLGTGGVWRDVYVFVGGNSFAELKTVLKSYHVFNFFWLLILFYICINVQLHI